MAYLKVQDSQYVRDPQTGALINQDYSARDEYFAKVKMLTANKNEINKLNDELSELKSEMSEIKELMKQLLAK